MDGNIFIKNFFKTASMPNYFFADYLVFPKPISISPCPPVTTPPPSLSYFNLTSQPKTPSSFKTKPFITIKSNYQPTRSPLIIDTHHSTLSISNSPPALSYYNAISPQLSPRELTSQSTNFKTTPLSSRDTNIQQNRPSIKKTVLKKGKCLTKTTQMR